MVRLSSGPGYTLGATLSVLTQRYVLRTTLMLAICVWVAVYTNIPQTYLLTWICIWRNNCYTSLCNIMAAHVHMVPTLRTYFTQICMHTIIIGFTKLRLYYFVKLHFLAWQFQYFNDGQKCISNNWFISGSSHCSTLHVFSIGFKLLSGLALKKLQTGGTITVIVVVSSPPKVKASEAWKCKAPVKSTMCALLIWRWFRIYLLAHTMRVTITPFNLDTSLRNVY